MDIKRERALAELLTEVGIPTNLLGYHYMKLAISEVLDNYKRGNYSVSMTKVIYPKIASLCNTTSSRVERGMRHAVDVLFNRTDLDRLSDILKNTISPKTGKPTNSEIICRLAEYYRLNRMN